MHELQLRIAINFFWNCIYLNELQIATDFLQTLTPDTGDADDDTRTDSWTGLHTHDERKEGC